MDLSRRMQTVLVFSGSIDRCLGEFCYKAHGKGVKGQVLNSGWSVARENWRISLSASTNWQVSSPRDNVVHDSLVASSFGRL